jgi:hypothetical protein
VHSMCIHAQSLIFESLEINNYIFALQ